MILILLTLFNITLLIAKSLRIVRNWSYYHQSSRKINPYYLKFWKEIEGFDESNRKKIGIRLYSIIIYTYIFQYHFKKSEIDQWKKRSLKLKNRFLSVKMNKIMEEIIKLTWDWWYTWSSNQNDIFSFFRNNFIQIQKNLIYSKLLFQRCKSIQKISRRKNIPISIFLQIFCIDI